MEPFTMFLIASTLIGAAGIVYVALLIIAEVIDWFVERLTGKDVDVSPFLMQLKPEDIEKATVGDIGLRQKLKDRRVIVQGFYDNKERKVLQEKKDVKVTAAAKIDPEIEKILKKAPVGQPIKVC